jgi:hypothetical protein
VWKPAPEDLLFYFITYSGQTLTVFANSKYLDHRHSHIESKIENTNASRFDNIHNDQDAGESSLEEDASAG